MSSITKMIRTPQIRVSFCPVAPHLLGPFEICLILNFKHNFVDCLSEDGIHPLITVFTDLVVFLI